jgi:hypothetical protein
MCSRRQQPARCCVIPPDQHAYQCEYACAAGGSRQPARCCLLGHPGAGSCRCPGSEGTWRQVQLRACSAAALPPAGAQAGKRPLQWHHCITTAPQHSFAACRRPGRCRAALPGTPAAEHPCVHACACTQPARPRTGGSAPVGCGLQAAAAGRSLDRKFDRKFDRARSLPLMRAARRKRALTSARCAPTWQLCYVLCSLLPCCAVLAVLCWPCCASV